MRRSRPIFRAPAEIVEAPLGAGGRGVLWSSFEEMGCLREDIIDSLSFAFETGLGEV
jgi:hypothetical protein